MTDIIDPFAQPAESSGIVDPYARRLDPATSAAAAPAADESGDFVRGFKRTLPELKQLAAMSPKKRASISATCPRNSRSMGISP